MPVCIYHAQDCLPAPVCIDVLLNDSTLLAAHHHSQLVFAQVEQLPSSFCPLRKHLLLSLQIGCQYPLFFMLIQSPIISLTNSADIKRAASGPISAVMSLPWLTDQLFHFHQFPCGPGAHISWILLCSASFTRDFWHLDWSVCMQPEESSSNST